MRKILKVLLPLLLITLAAAPALAAKRFVTIGTGGVTGVYYPVGKAIAKMVNAQGKQYGLRVTVESTGGSVFNINAVLGGDLDFGVAQSDRQYEAVHGLAEWKTKGKQGKLRSVFSLHPETFFMVASQNSGIKGYADLQGKAVAVGNPGSGTRQNSKDILAAYGLSLESLGRAEGLKASESAKVLQDGRVDAFAYTVGNPAGLIKEATSGRVKVRFLPTTDDALAKLLKNRPYYVKASIPVHFYEQALDKKDVPTFAVKATFVTRAGMPDEVVYAITKMVFTNLAALKKLHPALEVLKPRDMLQGLSAPLHPGALKYFKEAGLK
ncbi:MAG: TAXI family TRAP transporter solute-binding subunit [Desulfarculaceae bacterium]|nr:TAXI family TRAP transporter solute-binding subunit [Desulfarculaceae bacterium]MCF8070780.1 TAXI family TRAP transporter solute-binding subunit [Desulfarculaceae bacterium]MCF8102217.1 TAXI family TRAP transporter solute-binding subunit [Desulfarculaceae bacterium]MCF8116984.1 TAXI family TRAP transporter solute-binding subunit [Desulfarculaceae bacterium]